MGTAGCQTTPRVGTDVLICPAEQGSARFPDSVNQRRPEVRGAQSSDFGRRAGPPNPVELPSTGQPGAAVPTWALYLESRATAPAPHATRPDFHYNKIHG